MKKGDQSNEGFGKDNRGIFNDNNSVFSWEDGGKSRNIH
jgi:hypothetical protein